MIQVVMRFSFFVVAGLGIEPKFSLSESDVLPLDDPANMELFLESTTYCAKNKEKESYFVRGISMFFWIYSQNRSVIVSVILAV